VPKAWRVATEGEEGIERGGASFGVICAMVEKCNSVSLLLE
jgi:hypothetical protein